MAASWRSEGITPVIVDGGANVGYSALFFAAEYPEAVVVAVEPDPDTFKILFEACAGYSCIHPVHGALWSTDGEVRLSRQAGSSWSGTVDGEGDVAVPAFRIETLLELYPNPRPLLIKLDVEGAEREICLASAALLRRAPCIVVEPHDFKFPGKACVAPLFSALGGRDFDTVISGENIIILDAGLNGVARSRWR